MDLLLAISVAQAVVPPVALARLAATDPCAFERRIAMSSGERRPVSIDDQLRLAGIGATAGTRTPSEFGISPDGRKIAFVVKRPDPDANAYCQRLLVVSMSGEGSVVEADRGGEFIRDDFELREFPVMMSGNDRHNPPRWSPDGRQLAYLRREGQSTQVWVVDPEGRESARPATRIADDVDSFAWTSDGKGLVIASRPAIRLKKSAIEKEGLRGYLYDKRFGPQFADHPLITGDIPTAHHRVSLIDGSTRKATPEEIELVSVFRLALPTGAKRELTPGPDGMTAWLEPIDPAALLSPHRLVIAQASGERWECEGEQCSGIRNMWWMPQERALLILRSTGWSRSEEELLRWDPGDKTLRRVLLTQDLLIGCAPAGTELVCAREGSLQPRRLVAIDTSSGKERVIFDPNPQFGQFRLGKVQRLHIRNTYGVESFADLVLPPDHRPGQKHPLVVVQYRSSGFLRGGTGDEVPIQPLAARGFAVLSFDRGGWLPQQLKATSEAELSTLTGDAWTGRRQVQASLELALEKAIGTGAVDPARMGISGFSDGSSTVQYALLASDLFKAASKGSCCEDAYSYGLAPGPYWADFLRSRGYRYFEPGTEEFWKDKSLIFNVDRIDVPILIQASDTEYEGGLDVFEVFSHRGKPIELYVFPYEGHVKWQPAHRRALYERNVEWFDFWLMKRRDCSPGKDDQYSRWLAMAGAPAKEVITCFEPSGP